MIIFILYFLLILSDSLKIERADTIYKYHHTKDGFRNVNLAVKNPEFRVMLPFIMRRLWENMKDKKRDIPRVVNDGNQLQNNDSDATITWVGHSTLLIQIDGVNFLTDPVWNRSIGPRTPFDSRRLSDPGLEMDNMPKIDFVLISHDHYDHLDKYTIGRLSKDMSTIFIVPLKVGEILKDWGVRNIVELDWGDSVEYKSLKIFCTPAQHFSGRGFSRNKTLWASYVVKGNSKRFYYTGDSGYWKHFAEIGETYGPFDLAAIPIGAYKPKEIMNYMHLNPDKAVSAFLDLKAKYFVPIHYGTFILSDESVEEPPKLLIESLKNQNLNEDDFWILKLGETREW